MPTLFRNLTHSRWAALLVALPLLIFAAGCDGNGDDDEDVNNDPDASFTSSVDGLTVEFNDTSTDDGNIVSWSWDFGDGEDSSQQNPTHTYADGGEYTVELTVTDNEGAQSTTTNTVNVESGMVTVTENITANTTWTADNTYILDGLIFVGEETVNADGTADEIPAEEVVLTIEPGTVIKALQQRNVTTGDGASALIVRRSGRLEAAGEATAPIIFTSELDDISDPDDLQDSQFNPRRGLWGGIIILGEATNNEGDGQVVAGGTQIEGVPNEQGTYARFGGSNDEDNSGTLTYVSIRHGGFSISGVPGDEINGLTMGSVGSGTTISHVEVFANFDDAYEWFGGTVHSQYLAAAFVGDDSFDYDQGFRGTGQFWFSIHDTDQAGRSGEHDGGDSAGDDAMPFSRPVISNATYIGSGEDAEGIGGDGNDRTFAIRDNAGGEYYNSIFAFFPGVAADLEDKGAGSTRERFDEGDLVFQNNVFYGYGAFDEGEDGDEDDFDEEDVFEAIINGTFADDYFAENNEVTNPGFGGVTRSPDGTLDLRPSGDLGGFLAPGEFANNASLDLMGIQSVDFLGAFDPDEALWTDGWTALSQNGYTSN